MFARVMRLAIVMRRAAEPAYSIARYCATSVPKTPARCNTTSFDITASESSPSRTKRIVGGTRSHSSPVANT
jgi:hypothetical protein